MTTTSRSLPRWCAAAVAVAAAIVLLAAASAARADSGPVPTENTLPGISVGALTLKAANDDITSGNTAGRVSSPSPPAPPTGSRSTATTPPGAPSR